MLVKKICFSFFLLLLSFFLFSFAGRVSAQTPTITPEVKKVDYIMPYPGILPDHPLYPLKAIRDKIYDSLLTDLIKKTEFKLLMADKRVIMTQKLLEKGRPELAETTMSKASKYYEEAVLTLYKARNQGRDTLKQTTKLIDSAKKYEELVSSFPKIDSSVIKDGIMGSLSAINKYKNELSQTPQMQNQK